MSESWGHKVTVSAYFEGKPDDLGIEWAIQQLNDMWPDAAFLGVAVADVQTEPGDQVVFSWSC